MAGEIQLNSITMATESSGTITLSNVNSATNRTNLGLGSIATQAADSVSISGGTIGSGVTFPAGHVLQVVQPTPTTTETAINTSTFTDTGLSATITPSSTSSKILVLVNQQVRNAASNPSTLGCRLRLLRNSGNELSLSGEAAGQFDSFEITADNGGNVRVAGYISFNYLDSPSTTSLVTYEIQASTNSGPHYFQNSSSISIMTLMEIAA